MKIPFRRMPSGMVLFTLFILFSGCSTDKSSEERIELLYRKAFASSRGGEYLQAIGLFNKALALDTLKGASPRVVRALHEKRAIEGVTGEYEEAFKSTARLEQLPQGALPDSLRDELLSDKATWLRELGSFRSAAEALAKIRHPSQKVSFELASLYQQSGEYGKAATIYRSAAGSDRHPVVSITAYAGLLQCKVAAPQLALDAADYIARKILAESGKVLALKGDLESRVQALRAASKSLQLLEKHRRNASYLLFRALMLAEESRNQPLLQVIRLESNAVIVRKAGTCREVADYFHTNTMQYAEVVSLFMLSGSKSLEAEERIVALQRAFSLSRDYAPPYPTSELFLLEKNARRSLNGLLLEKSRIFDLFDASVLMGILDLQRSLQQYPDSFILGKGHDALASDVRRLQREISGLLQRKADIFIHAEEFEKNRLVDQALNIKKGKLLELQSEVRAVNPIAAEAMRPLPVTLRTVQGALKEEEILLKPLFSDHRCGVMLISKRQLQIAGSALSFDSLHTPESGIRSIRKELAAAFSALFQPGSEQEWFTRALYEPLAGSISGYRHLVIIADDLFPYHILGFPDRSGQEQQYSFVQSIKEFTLLSENFEPFPVSSQIYFYDVDNVAGARMHKLFSPHDRLFLLWKPYRMDELEMVRQQIAKEMQGTVSSSGALSALVKASVTGRETWRYISSFGVD
jgi:tetratricopeptide (TPR) repeat protein